ncbi:hypothetical protein [Sinanaerobacter chloroacetimidivorans]|jgi:hypothetical protein|uniref:Transporter n=1 Tax=Sinanaerobacter chloroacetimidivorans TaxID=2818044 RepID=A0A8J7VYU8_9FIRM|nr:hypothetical protein [Sinanaerobacter chloroacetimidivorans]MBR0597599.1 hypothetical protein [Sinanaerobacter chloroacetimidivorans]
MFENQNQWSSTMPPPDRNIPYPVRQMGDPGLKHCINQMTYIWLKNGNEFWFYPTFVGRQTMLGFRWRRMGWTRDRVNIKNIRSFQCF